MTNDRYIALERGNNEDGPHLTQEEILQGWHWCQEWDGMLVGPGMQAMSVCICDIPVRTMLENKEPNAKHPGVEGRKVGA